MKYKLSGFKLDAKIDEVAIKLEELHKQFEENPSNDLARKLISEFEAFDKMKGYLQIPSPLFIGQRIEFYQRYLKENQ